MAYKLEEYAPGIWVSKVNFVEKLGRQTCLWIEALGDYVRFMLSICYWMARGPGRFARQQLLIQMFEVGTLSIPVVMITGRFTEPDDKVQGFESGADEFFSKTFDPYLFVARLKSILRGAAPQAA